VLSPRNTDFEADASCSNPALLELWLAGCVRAF